MLRVLPTVGITVRMVVTATIMIIRPCSLLQHKKKKQTITKREKTKGKQKHHQNLSNDSVEESNSTKSHRFQIISKFECHKWELPGEVADYVNHKF